MKKQMKKQINRQMAKAALLGTALSVLLPSQAALAQTADGAKAAELLLENRQEYILHRTPTDVSEESFPARFDLRDQGYVTPVKFQNPWGTCWGFAAIAAAETSLLSERGKTYEETGLDLSEHHLTWFARTHIEDESSSQYGEGVYLYDEADHLNTGGMNFTATSLFSSGIGVVSEERVPYRGKESKTVGIFKNHYYSPEDDWSLPAEYEFVQTFELENSDVLLSPAVYDPSLDVNNEEDFEKRNAAYLGYDQAATDEMKRELMNGRAISVGFAADQFMPSQLGTGEEARYLNVADNHWTHYTYDSAPATHAVTIVGWDDSIRRTDFLDHSGDRYGDGLAHQPEGDGAWIVKNSWGAETESFPNRLSWGIEDENGNATGYFYLSYYDRSIAIAETFDFKADPADKAGYLIDQYDFLQSESTAGWLDENEIRMANVYTADYDERLRGLSCETNAENTTVHYQVYLLNADAEDPEDGTLVAEAEGFYAHAGYHRLDLAETADIAKGQKYSVIVTQTLSHEGKDYYGISTTMAANKAAVDAYNREQKRLHEDSFKVMYAKGVVNPGESYVYLGSLGGWSDFSEVIPSLQKAEAFSDYDFDNFPIKAYLDYQNEADIALNTAEGLPDLGYAKPAGPYRVKAIVKLTLYILILLLALEIVPLVKNHRKKKLLKKLTAELSESREQLAKTEAELLALKQAERGETQEENMQE